MDIVTTSVQIYIFNDAFNKYTDLILEDQMCFIIGRSFNDSSTQTLSRMVANKIYRLDNLRKTITKQINVLINYVECDKTILNNINALQKDYRGNFKVVLHLQSKHGRVQKILLPGLKLSCQNKTLIKLRSIIRKRKNVWLSI